MRAGSTIARAANDRGADPMALTANTSVADRPQTLTILRSRRSRMLTLLFSLDRMVGGGSRKGSKGNAVRALAHNAAAAPATVSGEPPTINATENACSWEGGRRQGPASQETCHRRSHARAQQAGCPDVAGPVAPSREAVRRKRRQFAVTASLPQVSPCPCPLVLTSIGRPAP